MSKESLKLSFSIVAVLIGVTGCIASLLLLPHQAHDASCFLLTNILLAVVGTISCYFSKQRLDIIDKLKSNTIQHLARWHYTPCSYTFMRKQIHDKYIINCSTLVLAAILLIVILGLLLSTNSLPLDCLLALLLAVVGGSMLALIHYAHCMKKSLSCSHEVIVSEQYIFFNNELYSTHKGIYSLTDVCLLEGDENYLKFTYGSPGTPYGPFLITYVPIPSSHLQDGQKIQKVYSRWLDF